MNTLTTPSQGEVSIDIAQVSIRVVTVGGKSMTVSIYNQLPHQSTLGHLEEPDLENDPEHFIQRLGRINQCSNSCPNLLYGHTHVFGINSQGEPVLEIVDAAGRELRLDYDSTARAIGRNYESKLDDLKQTEERLATRLENVTTDSSRVAIADSLQQAQRERLRHEALPAELESIKLEWRQHKKWIEEVIEPLPQLYIAK